MTTATEEDLISEYLRRGGSITIGKYHNPRKDERTFRNYAGNSISNIGKKANTLQSQGIPYRA